METTTEEAWIVYWPMSNSYSVYTTYTIGAGLTPLKAITNSSKASPISFTTWEQGIHRPYVVIFKGTSLKQFNAQTYPEYFV